jgi:hypothetical protein
MSDCDQKFFGKYRGTVINNIDPLLQGRILVTVTDVYQFGLSNWAMPCVPIGGTQSGIFAVPMIGSGVWIEFEQGDPDYPIWVGGFWGSMADPPITAQGGVPAMPNIVMQTFGQNSITLFGAPGVGITLSCGPVMNPLSPKIMITQAGIILSAGAATITMTAAGQIDFNFGALTILK